MYAIAIKEISITDKKKKVKIRKLVLEHACRYIKIWPKFMLIHVHVKIGSTKIQKMYIEYRKYQQEHRSFTHITHDSMSFEIRKVFR